MPLSWINPFCDNCHTNLRTGRDPIRSVNPVVEPRCCMCNQPTTSGIWVYIDPYRVKYPKLAPPQRSPRSPIAHKDR